MKISNQSQSMPIAALAGLAGILLTATSAHAQSISVNNGDFTDAGDITVINSLAIQDLGSATTGAWYSGKGAAPGVPLWKVDIMNGLAKVGGTTGNGVALFQVIEVGGDVSTSSNWTFSFDIASTAGGVIGDDVAVGIYTWKSTEAAPTIDLADSSVGAIYSLGTLNTANAELNSNTRHDFVFDEGLVIANEGGLTVGADGGTYSVNFTLDAGDDRVAIIFAGRHRSTPGVDAFSIDNVAITPQVASIPFEITSFSVHTVADTATINFRGAPNTSYICKSSTDLVSFPTTETAVNSTTFTTGPDTGDGTGIGTAQVDISAAGDKRFYRLETP